MKRLGVPRAFNRFSEPLGVLSGGVPAPTLTIGVEDDLPTRRAKDVLARALAVQGCPVFRGELQGPR